MYLSPALVQDEERAIKITLEQQSPSSGNSKGVSDYLRKSTRYRGSDWKDYPYYLCSDMSRSNGTQDLSLELNL